MNAHSRANDDAIEVIRQVLDPVEAAIDDPQRGAAAVLAPVVPTDEGLCFLFERRAQGPDRFAGHMSFPGGRIEPEDASPLQAALREAHEEVGFTPDDVDVLGHLCDTTDPLGRHVGCFVGVVRPEAIPQKAASPAEVAELIVVPFPALLRPFGDVPAHGTQHEYQVHDYECRMIPAREHVVQYWHLRAVDGADEAVLWGFTGGLVARFLHQVYDWSPPRAPRIVDDWGELQP